jgi:hypothetical protein
MIDTALAPPYRAPFLLSAQPTEKPLPLLTKFLSDIEEPKEALSHTLSDLPNLAKHRADIEEPKMSVPPLIENLMQLPILCRPMAEHPDPALQKERTLSPLPMLAAPRMVAQLPHFWLQRTDTEEPMYMHPRVESACCWPTRLGPMCTRSAMETPEPTFTAFLRERLELRIANLKQEVEIPWDFG